MILDIFIEKFRQIFVRILCHIIIIIFL